MPVCLRSVRQPPCTGTSQSDRASHDLMELVNLVKCTKYRTVKGCCGEEMGADGEKEGDDRNKEEFLFAGWKSKPGTTQPSVNLQPGVEQDRYEETDGPGPWSASASNSIYLPRFSCDRADQTGLEPTQDETFSSLNTEKDFLCPRCGKRMQEPRLLACLHPICSPCVVQLMSIRDGTNERCPLCDFRLPNASSAVPPAHYPLQHRLIMDAIRSRLVNRVLCDACSDEVVAVAQCSACLRNLCADCGIEHQQQIAIEPRPLKHHSVRPLWEATKVRRTALCQLHPSHALRFYCIACQQVTCKECMWSAQHRGHASENAIGAGKRAALYLTTLLQRAKLLLSYLLSQYDREAFANGPHDDPQDVQSTTDYRYVESFLSLSLNVSKIIL